MSTELSTGDRITTAGLAKRLSALQLASDSSSSSSSSSSSAASSSPSSSSSTFFSGITDEASRDRSVRKTKITCTLGPSSSTIDQIAELILSGMNVARLNFSHGSHESHLQVVENVRAAMEKAGRKCALMLDTKGPEIRTGLLTDGKAIILKSGSELLIWTSKDYNIFVGNSSEICVDYRNLSAVVQVGSIVKIDDGLIVTKVSAVNHSEGWIKVLITNTAEMGQRKGVNLPGSPVDLPAVTPRDKLDLVFAAENGLDLIAASFARDAAGIREIRAILGEKGKNIKIISKIESQQGLDNFDDILRESDGIMVARGDLGVEIPIQKVCMAQKMMIRKCNLAGKPVITATQMLESMVSNPRPTRAEATDVANAVFDGSDCVMLSGETAKGDYPFLACSTMAKICRSTELVIDHEAAFSTMVYFTTKPINRAEAITSSAVKAAMDLDVAAIIVLTESGSSARFVSKYRPSMPIIMITRDSQIYRQHLVVRGIWPLLISDVQEHEELVARGIAFAKQQEWIPKNKPASVILVSGMVAGQTGTTDTMKVIDVPPLP